MLRAFRVRCRWRLLAVGLLGLGCAAWVAACATPVAPGSAAPQPGGSAPPAPRASASPTTGAGPATFPAQVARRPIRATAPPAPPVTPTPARGHVVVDAADDFFSPAQLVVAVGATVTWKNVGGEGHDVVAEDGSFVSNALGPGETFSHTFTRPGTYRYVCTFHAGEGMVGDVTVR